MKRNSISANADHPREQHTQTRLCSCNLDLDPMTFKYEFYLDVLKMWMHVQKMKFLDQGVQMLEH